MGCDIHAMIERKKFWRWPNPDGTPHTSWINAGDPGLDRDYDTFSLLADCGRDRYGVQPLSAGRGVPRDACDEFDSHVQRYNGDGHSHGWVTLRELQAYPLDDVPWPDRIRQDNRERYLALVQELERVALRYDGDPDAVRLVFFFDN